MAEDNNTVDQPKAPELSKLMKEAMGRFGIKPCHVFASTDYSTRVRILTFGGKKVSYAPGDKVTPLSDIELTGIPPAKPKK